MVCFLQPGELLEERVAENRLRVEVLHLEPVVGRIRGRGEERVVDRHVSATDDQFVVDIRIRTEDGHAGQ